MNLQEFEILELPIKTKLRRDSSNRLVGGKLVEHKIC